MGERSLMVVVAGLGLKQSTCRLEGLSCPSPVTLSFPLSFLPPSLTWSVYDTNFCSIHCGWKSCPNWFDQDSASSLIQWVLSVISNEVGQ